MINLNGFSNTEECLLKASFYKTPQGNIKLNKEQLDRINSLSEEDLTQVYKKSTGVDNKTVEAWKKHLSKQEKINVVINIVSNKEYGNKILKDIFDPKEGEVKEYKDGTYVFTQGHWKKQK
jgi:hypothetical protein